jgi:hypothetical protein
MKTSSASLTSGQPKGDQEFREFFSENIGIKIKHLRRRGKQKLSVSSDQVTNFASYFVVFVNFFNLKSHVGKFVPTLPRPLPKKR